MWHDVAVHVNTLIRDKDLKKSLAFEFGSSQWA